MIMMIMVAYHRPNDLQESLRSIFANTGVPYHLHIIDNSLGGVDDVLNKFERVKSITIHRKESNVGKGAGVMQEYGRIMRGYEGDFFVSIDSDVRVEKGWISKLMRAAVIVKSHEDFAFIAPTIKNRPQESLERQLATNNVIMHGPHMVQSPYPMIYYNRNVAGPLLFIDRAFFEKVGGFYTEQLYGADDGLLCKAAEKIGAATCVAEEVEVTHLHADSTEGYMQWKMRNVTRDVDKRGYWD